MVEFFRGLFASGFMPHGMCYLWDPAVLWLNVISDGLISLCYYAIPLFLIGFFRSRQDLTFRWIFVAFAVFIVACGTTHAMGIWTVWHGAYRLDGVIKAITALASLVTAVLLIPLLPTLVKLPSPTALQQVNQRLEDANLELKQQIERGLVLEDQLAQAQKMEAIGRLAGGVAHDFNNMLTVILGYNRMVLDKAGQYPDTLDNAGEVQRAAERAATLTKQLLAFSRRQVFKPRAIDLNEVVGNMEKLLRPVIGEDIDFATCLEPTLATVQADPGHIDQIIMNLVVNAKDAMGPGGKLTIETANVNLDEAYAKSHPGITPGRHVQLTIGDNGPGMNEETKQRIFEPFFTTKELGQGTGMGLAIVFGIVKQSGGDISVDSQEGKGTTFKICLPAATSSDTSLEAAKPPPRQPTGKQG
jgi:signal transduction histidine kinase